MHTFSYCMLKIGVCMIYVVLYIKICASKSDNINTYQGSWNRPTEKKFQKLNQQSDGRLELFFLERFRHPDKYSCTLLADPV